MRQGQGSAENLRSPANQITVWCGVCRPSPHGAWRQFRGAKREGGGHKGAERLRRDETDKSPNLTRDKVHTYRLEQLACFLGRNPSIYDLLLLA